MMASQEPVETGMMMMKKFAEQCGVEGIGKEAYDILVQCIKDVAQQVAESVHEKFDEARDYCKINNFY